MKKLISSPVIGVWAGSSPARPALLKKGYAALQTRAPIPLYMPPLTALNATRKESSARAYLAGSDLDKVRAFQQLWNTPHLRTIFCVRGGYGTLRLLRHLDSVALKKKSLQVWGFSDLTVLQHYLYGRMGTPWVHSPMLTTPSWITPSAREARYWKKVWALSALAEPKTDFVSFPMQILYKPRGLPSRNSALPLLGGNLASLMTLMGTPWEPRPHHRFNLFLEDLNEDPYKLDRLLEQLARSAFFKRCQAVVLGHFTNISHHREILKQWAQENGILTLSGLPVGHQSPHVPLQMGLPTQISLKKLSAATLTVPIPFV